jgi:hypothetical protein
MDQHMDHETRQHKEESALALGIHPTYSVSTISFVPNMAVDEALLHSSCRRYVLPGSKSVASVPVVAPGVMAMGGDDEVLEEYVI